MSQTCNQCKKIKDINDFNKKTTGFTKSCTSCLEIDKKCRDKNKCIHNKRKNRCRECGGSSICIHDKLKSECRDCDGSAFCVHNKFKSQCRECDGSAFCIHDKFKSQCRECDGSAFCIHDKKKSRCRECDGSSICIHNKHKSSCRECDGSSFCIHNKRKSRCIDCHPEKSCRTCFGIFVAHNSKYAPHCFYCYCMLNPGVEIPRQYKIKEHHVCDVLKTAFPETDLVFDKKVDNGCSRKRPDVRIECFTHTVVIECDENKHQGYSCENKRTMEIFEDLGNRPIIFIRFNPDKCSNRISCFSITKKGYLSLNKKEFKHRMGELVGVIKQNIKNIPEKDVSILKMFYE